MGFLDVIRNPLKVTMSHVSLPTNQFRLGEHFRFYIRFESNKDIHLDVGESYLQCTERLMRDTGSDEETSPTIIFLENAIYKQSFPITQLHIGPGWPLIVDTRFSIPLNKGWTMPGCIEWILVTVFKSGYKVFGHKFGITVLPFVLSSTKPMSPNPLIPGPPPEFRSLGQTLLDEIIKTLDNRACSEDRQSGFDLKTIIYPYPIDPRISEPVREIVLDGCYCVFLRISSEKGINACNIKMSLVFHMVEPEQEKVVQRMKWEDVSLNQKKPFVGQFLVKVPSVLTPTISMKLIRAYYELEVEIFIKEGCLGKTVKWKMPLTVLPGTGPEGWSDQPMPFTNWREYKSLP